MTEETKFDMMNEKELERLADVLLKKMKENPEKEMKEQLDKEKGSKESEPYAICTDNQCGRIFTKREYDNFRHCPDCGGTKARIITK